MCKACQIWRDIQQPTTTISRDLQLPVALKRKSVKHKIFYLKKYATLKSRKPATALPILFYLQIGTLSVINVLSSVLWETNIPLFALSPKCSA